MEVETEEFTYDSFIRSLQEKYSLNCYPLKEKLFRPKLYTYAVTTTSDQKRIDAGGTHFNEAISKIKAVAEIAERISLQVPLKYWTRVHKCEEELDPHVNTNGLAFGLTPESAIERAKNELIEREMILDAWFYARPIFPISRINRFSLLLKLNALFHKMSANIYYIPNNLGKSICIAHISNSKQAPFSTFGFGCDNSLNKSAEKALCEAWRLYSISKKLKERHFKKNDVKDFIDSLKYYSLNNIPTSTIYNFQKGKRCSSAKKPSQAPKQTYNVYLCNLSVTLGVDGYVAKVTNQSFHKFLSGPIKNDIGIRKAGDIPPIA